MQHETKIFIPHTAREISYAASRFFQGQSRDRVFIIEKKLIHSVSRENLKSHQRDTHSHTHAHTIKINDSLFPNF